jgi:hypothetical protein
MAEPHSSPEPAAPAPEIPSSFLELYKLAVEMADRVSARRAVSNSFFLTVNTGLTAFIASSSLRWYVAGAGLVFSVTWWALLKSYRDLNSAKFQVILDMENQLPIRVYGSEWDMLKREPVKLALKRETIRSWISQYRELGRVERIVPWVFAAIYAIELIRRIGI